MLAPVGRRMKGREVGAVRILAVRRKSQESPQPQHGHRKMPGYLSAPAARGH